MNIPNLIDDLLQHSRSEECIILIQKDTAANIRWANTTLTTNGQSEQLYLAIFAITGGRVGSIIASFNEQTNLYTLLASAEAKAKVTSVAFDATTVLDGNSQWPTAATKAVAAVPTMEHLYAQLADCFNRAKKQSLSLFGYSKAGQKNYWIATSKGLRKYASHQESSIQLNLKTPDFTKSVWAGMATHAPNDLDLVQLYKQLEQKMAWSDKTIALPAGKYETILEPSAVADLLIDNYWSSAARDADEGKSVYARPGGKNAIGEQLYSQDISLYSDPQALGLEVPPFDIASATSAEQSIFDNGLELKKTEWVKNGVLRALITPRYWAQKQGQPANPYIPNLIFDHPAGPTVDKMIKRTKRGLLVTCLWYIRVVDPQTLLLTGLTRDGVFLVENGKVVASVNNFRFNMSPIATLAQTIEIGKTEPTLARELGSYFTFVAVPPLRVKDFNMSTVSDAV